MLHSAIPHQLYNVHEPYDGGGGGRLSAGLT